MKFVSRKILETLLLIVLTPAFMINGVVQAWRTVFDDPQGENTVNNLILYGWKNYGFYDCGIVICKNLGDNIWSYEGDFWLMNIPDSILQMKVCNWDVKDGKLWIKVVVDDRLIEKLEQELKEKARNEVKEDH